MSIQMLISTTAATSSRFSSFVTSFMNGKKSVYRYIYRNRIVSHFYIEAKTMMASASESITFVADCANTQLHPVFQPCTFFFVFYFILFFLLFLHHHHPFGSRCIVHRVVCTFFCHIYFCAYIACGSFGITLAYIHMYFVCCYYNETATYLDAKW